MVSNSELSSPEQLLEVEADSRLSVARLRLALADVRAAVEESRRSNTQTRRRLRAVAAQVSDDATYAASMAAQRALKTPRAHEEEEPGRWLSTSSRRVAPREDLGAEDAASALHLVAMEAGNRAGPSPQDLRELRELAATASAWALRLAVSDRRDSREATAAKAAAHLNSNDARSRSPSPRVASRVRSPAVLTAPPPRPAAEVAPSPASPPEVVPSPSSPLEVFVPPQRQPSYEPTIQSSPSPSSPLEVVRQPSYEPTIQESPSPQRSPGSASFAPTEID